MMFFVVVFLLMSCVDDGSQVAMKNLESDNELLQEQIKSMEKENELLKKQNQELIKDTKSLNKIVEEKNSKIDVLREKIYKLEKNHSLSRHNHQINKSKTLQVDLNNDDDKDFVELECSNGRYYRLSINDISIIGIGKNIDCDFEIKDIDTRDNIKEIAISKLGSNNNPQTAFFRYGINNIFYIGKVEGHINDIKLNGDGSLTTTKNGNILHSWSYTDKYKLSAQHILVREPKELYEMNSKAKVLKSIPLLKSTTENEMVAALTVGEEVTLIASDNKRWCLVEKQNGVRGWFQVEDFNKIIGTDFTAPNVFEGLNYNNQIP